MQEAGSKRIEARKSIFLVLAFNGLAA